MADKEKIKAEIERRIKIATGEQYLSLKSLLSFIDSMQEEPVSEELEKAAVDNTETANKQAIIFFIIKRPPYILQNGRRIIFGRKKQRRLSVRN